MAGKVRVRADITRRNEPHLFRKPHNPLSVILTGGHLKASSRTDILRCSIGAIWDTLPTAMASKVSTSVALRHSVELSTLPLSSSALSSTARSTTSPNSKASSTVSRMISIPVARDPDDGEPPTQGNCDEVQDDEDSVGAISSTAAAAGQTIAPFLAKHIPQQYAPLGFPERALDQTDPNTKYCYRHRPGLKCRRTADEPSMENLQRVCIFLTSIDSH